ncbi:MAG: glycoside hydrolase family 3 C-terminal domain-containing protein [Candidatus Binatia bacterium]|nr:glycoside hydrolase family 3 C-terminal domain-containing protein [Candidatus Binatia bacterium]
MAYNKLLDDLTLDEKALLTAGADMWNTVAIERLGVPALKMTDGPNGARGDALLGAGAATAACVPCGSALGATWNLELVQKIGAMLGEEARTKSCRVLLAPTINMHRSPLGGRSFECYSEDPLLSGQTAAAFVRGVQSYGVAATAKHFVANDAEFERYSMNSVVDDRALREIYLLPFELAVREGGVLAIMTGYNRVNGTYCSENDWLLTKVLRDEWGFRGIVMTDWFSAGDTAGSSRAGLDLQMPGPGRFFGAVIAEAVRNGELEESVVDEMARRILGVVDQLRAWKDSADKPERSEDRPEHRTLARQAASESMVLLRNDGLLPLDASTLGTVALVGPNWGRAHIMGGGSAALRPHYRVPALEVMQERLEGKATLLHHRGCDIDRTARPITRSVLTTQSGEPGLAVDLFTNLDCEGEPAAHLVYDDARLMFFGSPADGIAADNFSVRATARFTPDVSGAHVFTLVQAGQARVLIDGKTVLDGVSVQPPRGTQFFGMGSEEIEARVDLEAGRSVDLMIEYSTRDSFLLRGAQVGHRPPVEQDMVGKAAQLAADADVAIVMVGTSDEWESEGHDRRSMDLPGDQDELIRRVRAANEKTIVVVNTGSPVTMDWADDVSAVLHSWLGGQEMGNAIADILLGEAEPAGRLPTTFPERLEHNPSYGNFPGENGEVRYGEGVLVGYRWFDTRKIPVRYPFGHGLSYSTFEISKPELASSGHAPGGPLLLRVSVKNTGKRRGAEVVQAYVAPKRPRLVRPEKELKAFAKVWLEPGQRATVTMSLEDRAFAYWDPCAPDQAALKEKLGAIANMLPGGVADAERTEPGWYIDAGDYEIRVGRSSADIAHTIPLTITEDAFLSAKGPTAES